MALDISDRIAAPAERSMDWLGCTEMAETVRVYDWSGTPLGPLHGWPQSLKSTVSLCLRARFPMAIYWGPELTCIYNDAHRDVLGDLHPWALGLPAWEVLRDSWEIVGPQLDAALAAGESTWAEDQPFVSDRHSRLEEAYFTHSCTPLLDEDGSVGGALLVSQDTTARVRAERRTDSQALLNDLRAAQRRVAMAADAERRRIERDLHDGAQQRLMALRLELGLLEERLPDDPRGALRLLRELRRELDEAVEELRELAHGLYPPLLVSDGLEAALTAAARRSPIPVVIAANGMTRAPRSIESTAYFCCLEALQNTAKHAGPGAQAMVELRMSDGCLTFRISDDGAGFNPEVVRAGHGLINLRDRMQALGGEAHVTSSPGAGTTVLGRIPMP